MQPDRSAATGREDACRAWCDAAGYAYEPPGEREDPPSPHIEAFLAGFTSGTRSHEEALAWSQQRLRAFGHDADADEVLGWYGLTYEEPKPVVRHA